MRRDKGSLSAQYATKGPLTAYYATKASAERDKGPLSA